VAPGKSLLSSAMKHCASFLAFLLSLATLPSAFAEDFDPVRFIGLDPQAAFSTLGSPQEVFAFRGADEKQDNVVFFYPDFLYLFWYRNRVWQVRVDMRFAKPVFGLSLGMTEEEVEKSRTRPLIPAGNSLYFNLDDEKFPLRVRLLFTSGVLSDVYVYRSDY
jgi:hypothetical protein